MFDDLPPSGARRGDDPAQHAFAPTLASFVREVIQNANDLRATASSRAGRRIVAALDRFARARSLPVLTVEDRGTVGLSGEEDESTGHFRALCKDTLFSHKRDASAGASYGLGKSVLWAFSGLRTVMFASALVHDPAGRRSPRFFGRSALPSHQTDDGAWAGPGWFGRPVEVGAATGPHSRGPKAVTAADRMP